LFYRFRVLRRPMLAHSTQDRTVLATGLSERPIPAASPLPRHRQNRLDLASRLAHSSLAAAGRFQLLLLPRGVIAAAFDGIRRRQRRRRSHDKLFVIVEVVAAGADAESARFCAGEDWSRLADGRRSKRRHRDGGRNEDKGMVVETRSDG
jgi:hypothetical protein